MRPPRHFVVASSRREFMLWIGRHIGSVDKRMCIWAECADGVYPYRPDENDTVSVADQQALLQGPQAGAIRELAKTCPIPSWVS